MEIYIKDQSLYGEPYCGDGLAI